MILLLLIELQRAQIGEKAVNSINGFLEQIAKEVKGVMGILCTDHLKKDELVSTFRHQKTS